ncbi:MAG: metallophosphoesterase [Phycisphaerae bacterium]
MTRGVAFSIFLAVLGSVLALAHWYLWKRKVRDTAPPRLVRRVVTGVLVAGGVLIPTALVGARAFRLEAFAPLVYAAFVWLGFVFYAVLLLVSWDVLWGLLALAGRRPAERGGVNAAPAHAAEKVARASVTITAGEPRYCGRVDVGRRVFLARVGAGTAFVGAGGLNGWGVREALSSDIRTPEVPVRLARLPRALSGFRIAVLADLHIGPVLGREFVEQVVEQTNRLRADAVVIVGDLVDNTPARIANDIEPLARLAAAHGVYFATGNHEFYVGADAWLAHLPTLGIRVLANERVAVGDRNRGGATFDLAGVHDLHGGRFNPRHRPDVGAALAGRDAQRELILLAHQPRMIDDAARHGVGLQVSGHTHGGQLWPFGALVLLAQPYLAGLHAHTETTQIYVTRGTGFWGPPMRIGAPAEITQLVLTA